MSRRLLTILAALAVVAIVFGSYTAGAADCPDAGAAGQSAAVAQARAAVDLAMLGVLADGGLRRSEAAALTWPDGTARLTVQKGRNQPEPATVALTAAPARALRDLQPLRRSG